MQQVEENETLTGSVIWNAEYRQIKSGANRHNFPKRMIEKNGDDKLCDKNEHADNTKHIVL